MSNNVPTSQIEVEETEDVDYEDDDFGFIISANGELKSVMLPENLMDDPPLEVLMILKLFGITDLNEVDSKTLH